MQPGTSTLNGQVPTAGLSVTEAAQVLGVSPNTVRARIKAGRLRAERAQRPQGEVIRVFLDAEDLSVSGTSAGTSQQVPAGTYNTPHQVPALAGQAEAIAIALVPLVEAAVAPLRAELGDLRGLLSQRDQELGAVLERIRGLEAPKAESTESPPLGAVSDAAPREPTQTSSETRNGRPWWRLW